VCLTGLLASAACERTHNLASSEVGDTGLADAGAGDAGGEDGGPNTDATFALCGNSACACANGRDDDGDELTDGMDPECTGPYDEDEASFATRENKEGNPRCADCFFDGNARSNDDGCFLAESCVSDGTTTISSPMCDTCTPTEECVNNCLPRTPNGCDCFGCCLIDDGTRLIPIQLVDSCSLAVLDEEDKCPTCYPSSKCMNPCGRCELCAGKTLDDLPADCQGGEYGFTCDDGGEACETSQTCQGLGYYCVQGCCAPPVPF
jgi:hypothetical protein